MVTTLEHGCNIAKEAAAGVDRQKLRGFGHHAKLAICQRKHARAMVRTARSSNLRTRSCRSLRDRSQIFGLEIDA